MARDRQRAKQRQAERRARRLAEERPAAGIDGSAAAQPAPAEPAQDSPPAVPEVEDPRAAEPEPPIDPNLAVGAPPEDEGHSESLLEDEPELDGDEHLDEEQLEAEEEAEEEAGYAPRGHRVDRGVEPLAKDRPRLVQFLVAVWAELQRVQWPDRQTLTTLTGVVLGFVLIA
ncbi:MAG: preprotein translocase subunit SecE, partial [Thermoleophilaceae bacterium]